MVETEARPSRNFLKVLVDPANPNIDIVAVHGLNPTNTETHAELTWTAEGKLWLKDFLPEQLPNARMLLFGYNSNVAFGTSTAGVREQAENLLNRLEAKRRGAPDRPLLFVCHSLGGIVVKRALVHANSDRTYNSILHATYGLAFFGTPHQGGNLVKLGDIVARIGRALLRNPPNTFLEALKADSLFADDLAQDFRQRLEDYHVLSVYETKPTGVLGVVVDKKSATFGLPGGRERQIGLDADHASICKFPSIDGDDYQHVADNLVRLAESAVKNFADRQRMEALSAPAGPLVSEQNRRIFMVPYTSNPDFVGRETILEKLKGCLDPSHGTKKLHSQRRAALFGLGGVGKSQIAIEYAYWVHDQFPEISVFWVHGGTTERCHQTLSQIGLECKVANIENPNADKPELVRTWLESQKSGKWLMVVDNADNSEVFFKPDKCEPSGSGAKTQTPSRAGIGCYVPECSHGSILVTTRDKQAGIKLTRNRNLIEVAEMSQTESVELILKRIEGDSTDETDLAILADQLGNLPLTLVQAAAFIQENTLSIKAYLDILQSSDKARVNLLSQTFEEIGRDSEVPNAVTTTWMISFKQIKEQQPRAAELLSLMSFFNRQDIPKSLLRRYNKDLLELEKALGVLRAYSFITASVQDKGFNMHRLIHLVTRKWLEIEGEATQWAERGLTAVANSFPTGKFEGWADCAALLPHSYAVLDSAKGETVTQAYLLDHTAHHLYELGQWTEAERLCSQAVKIRKTILGLKHQDTLASMRHLVTLYHHLRQLDKALQLAVKVWKAQKTLLGSEHPHTLISMGTLTSIYHDLGQLNKGKQLGEEVWKTQKTVLGLEHPDTLISMNSLVSIYRSLGQLKKAEQLGEEVSKTTKTVLGLEHPDTLASMGSLATTYGHLGQLDKAKQLGEEVWKTRKTVLGSEHPHTLSSMDSLIETYCFLEQLDKAEQLGYEVFETRKTVLGLEHPDTLSSMERKGWISRWQNESPDPIEGASETSTHAEGESEDDWEGDSIGHVEGESEDDSEDKSLGHVEEESEDDCEDESLGHVEGESEDDSEDESPSHTEEESREKERAREQ